MRYLLISFIVLSMFSIVLSPVRSYPAVDSEIASRTDLGSVAEHKHDQWFQTVALVEGYCSEVNIPRADSRSIRWLYRFRGDGSKPQKSGIVYFNDSGREAVCLEDVQPFVERNIRGKLVNVSGWEYEGKDLGLECERAVRLEVLELME